MVGDSGSGLDADVVAFLVGLGEQANDSCGYGLRVVLVNEHAMSADEFGKRTGVPVIMNTSFNLRGEAIVNTPTDAIRTFFSSGMDALVIGGFVVEK